MSRNETEEASTPVTLQACATTFAMDHNAITVVLEMHWSGGGHVWGVGRGCWNSWGSVGVGVGVGLHGSVVFVRVLGQKTIVAQSQ